MNSYGSWGTHAATPTRLAGSNQKLSIVATGLGGSALASSRRFLAHPRLHSRRGNLYYRSGKTYFKPGRSIIFALLFPIRRWVNLEKRGLGMFSPSDSWRGQNRRSLASLEVYCRFFCDLHRRRWCSCVIGLAGLDPDKVCWKRHLKGDLAAVDLYYGLQKKMSLTIAGVINVDPHSISVRCLLFATSHQHHSFAPTWKCPDSLNSSLVLMN